MPDTLLSPNSIYAAFGTSTNAAGYASIISSPKKATRAPDFPKILSTEHCAIFDLVQIIGIAAAIASVASFFPQAWKIIKTRDIEGLSRPMYMLTAASFSLWLTFGMMKSEWALIVPNALCLAVTLFILAMLLMSPAKREHVAETLDPDPGK